MDIFTSIMNDAIDVAIKKNLTSEGSISREIYPLVKDLPIPSYYIPPAITKATAMVKNYRKSVRREEMRAKQKKNGGSKPKRKPRNIKIPHVDRRMLASHYGFRISDDNMIIPVSTEKHGREHEIIMLNRHVSSLINRNGVHARSFTLTPDVLSISIERFPETIECDSTAGIDRNLRNVTVGNELHQESYDLSEIVRIKRRYRNRSSRPMRNDRRIQQKIREKYGRRERSRTNAILHEKSKKIVEACISEREAPVLEDIRHIKRMTYRGDRTGPERRHLMHSSFPYGRLASMIKYKAEWEGLPVIQLTRQETCGTSSRCSECGSYTRKSGRMLYCESCDIWINRDINACISQAKRGRTRLVRSLLMEKGPPVEAVNQFKDGEQMAGSQILSTGS